MSMSSFTVLTLYIGTTLILIIPVKKSILLPVCVSKNCWMTSKLFVCVEVLRPSQPNGVMSSAVSLPNHTFTGQA